jgi:hypothetical protein
MSQPIRVEGWAYTPGARVSLRLRFRSQSAYARVKAEFHNPSGGVIKLGGVTHKRGIRDGSHRDRPYGQRSRKRRPRHLRVQIRGGAHRREEMGAHLRRPRLQHPRGPTTLPRPKRGRVPRARASLEGGQVEKGPRCLSRYRIRHQQRRVVLTEERGQAPIDVVSWRPSQRGNTGRIRGGR